MGITADFSGAIKKMNAALCIPKAVKLQAQRWLAETRQDLQKSATDMKKSWYVGQPKGQMAWNIGQTLQVTGTGWIAGVGTGMGGRLSVKYAKLQDEGGVTHPGKDKGMEGIRKWAWAMYYKSFKSEVRGLRLQGAARRGAFETFKGAGIGDKYKAIALTKKPFLTVNVPASKWFTSVIERREPILYEYLNPDVVYNIASQMRGGTG